MEIIIEITLPLFQINLRLQRRKNICQQLKEYCSEENEYSENLPTRGNTVTEGLVAVKN